MHLRKLLLTATAVTLVMFVSFSGGLRGQGLVDGIKVTLPEPVTIGDKVLQPGEYEIRRASSVNDNVLKIFNRDEMVYETNVITIPTLSKEVPEESKVVLHHIGDKYYFDKIWMEGRSYGYEFVLPERIEALRRDLAVTVPARYEQVQAAAVVESVEVENADEDSDVDIVAAAEVPVQDVQSDQAALAESNLNAVQEEQQAEVVDRDLQAQQEIDEIAALQPEPAPITSSSQSQYDARAAAQTPLAQANAQEPEQLPATASNWSGFIAGGVLLLMLSLLLRPLARTQE